jgi:Ca2+-binding RTX toxin-like protein
MSGLKSKPKPSVLAPELTLTAAYQPLEGMLLGDQTADKIFHLRDLNGDGDAADDGERISFFDAGNQSGLATPAANIFAIHQAADGTVYVGDGDSDSVYALKDPNNDGDANDAGEARVWFSAANADGHPLVTPNGVATGSDGAVYVVNAGVIAGPVDDVIYRTEDLNNDGDANDAGEAKVWLDLQTLNAKSSAFDLSFVGDIAYVTDTNGADPDTIYRIEDLDHDGTIEAGEAKIFISDTNPFGVPIDFAHAVQDGSVLTWELTAGAGGVSHVYRLTDLNGSGDIDQASEVQEVWNSGKMPAGFENSVGFAIAASANGDIAVTSNGTAANQKNVMRLTDLNGDGDYLDTGETILLASNALDAGFGQRPRSLGFYTDGIPDAHPVTYKEGGPGVLFASDLNITDADSAKLGGAVVKIVGGLDSAHDVLAVDLPKGSGIKASYDAATGTLTLKGLATADQYEAALQSLRFESRVDDPDESLRQISIVVQDERGASGASAPVYTTIGVEADESVHTVFGSARNEKLNGTSGDDRILAGGGNDTVSGKHGADRLFGEGGNDNLLGGAGDDLLSGGAGHDILTGGAGADKFIFTGKSQTDVITDFDVFRDEIMLEGVTYKGQEIHSLAEAGGAAHDFGPLTIYNFDNGATLWVVENPVALA